MNISDQMLHLLREGTEIEDRWLRWVEFDAKSLTVGC